MELESVTTSVEVLKLLELKYQNITKHTENVSTLGFSTDMLENVTADCTEENGVELHFLIEQIRLYTVENSTGRRCSHALLGMACMWNSSSSSLYKQILNEGVF